MSYFQAGSGQFSGTARHGIVCRRGKYVHVIATLVSFDDLRLDVEDTKPAATLLLLSGGAKCLSSPAVRNEHGKSL